MTDACPASVYTASRAVSVPRNSAVTGTSNAIASFARVDRLQEVWALSILENMALEMPALAAMSATDRPVARRRARTWAAIASSSGGNAGVPEGTWQIG